MLDVAERNAACERVREALHDVYDPELGVNIVDLGLVYGVDMDDEGFVRVTMTLTTPGCPMHASIGEGVAAVLATVPGVTGGDIRIVWDPPWAPDLMTEDGRRQLGYWG